VHFLDFRFENGSEPRDNLMADDQEIALLVGLGSAVSVTVVGVLAEDVSVTEVTAFNVRDERHEVRINLYLWLLLPILLVFVNEDLHVLFFRQ